MTPAQLRAKRLRAYLRLRGKGGERERRALGALVASMSGLVVAVARRHEGRCTHLATDDLIQEGAMGLVAACERFDPAQGNALSTVAVWWISGRIRRAIEQSEGTIHIPQRVARTRPPLRVASLDEPMGSDGALTLLELLPSSDANPEAAAMAAEQAATIAGLLAFLTPPQRHVLALCARGLAIAEVARRLKITRQAAHQTKSRATATLRKWARLRGLQETP